MFAFFRKPKNAESFECCCSTSDRRIDFNGEPMEICTNVSALVSDSPSPSSASWTWRLICLLSSISIPSRIVIAATLISLSLSIFYIIRMAQYKPNYLAYLRIKVLEICMLQVEFFQGAMRWFIGLGVEVACGSFIPNIIKHMYVCMCLWEIPAFASGVVLLVFLFIIISLYTL